MNQKQIFNDLLEIFQGPIEKIKDDLHCCGLVGSLERDIDLFCVANENTQIVPDILQLQRIGRTIYKCIKDARNLGLYLFPFTCFRTEIFLRSLSKQDNENIIPFHILVYPGINGLIQSEWPIIVKSLIESITEIVPVDKILKEQANEIVLPPLQKRLLNYVALLSETQLLLITNNDNNKRYICHEVLHKIKYIVRFAIAEYLFDKGELPLKNFSQFRPSKEHLMNFTDTNSADKYYEILEISKHGHDTHSLNLLCTISYNIIRKIITENNNA